MIVTCENCRVRYLVPLHAIGAAGRRVRCTACGHEWFQQPGDEEEPPPSPMPETSAAPEEDFKSILESIGPIPDAIAPPPDAAMPAPPARKRVAPGALTGYASAAGVLLIFFAASFAAKPKALEYWPPSAAYYRLFGIETPVPGEGLALDGVTASIGEKDGHPVFTVEGRIINLTESEVAVPSMVFAAIVADGAEGERWKAKPPRDRLGPREETRFSFTHAMPGHAPESIRVDLGGG